MKNKYRVLIVDDEEEILLELKEILEQEAYEVETAKSSIDALEKVKNEKFHIVLIDIGMPEMNGLELLKEIKKYDALTQIIMMTENSTMEQILSSLEFGANDYILKPFIKIENTIEVIDYSIEKLERWRQSIMELVK